MKRNLYTKHLIDEYVKKDYQDTGLKSDFWDHRPHPVSVDKEKVMMFYDFCDESGS